MSTSAKVLDALSPYNLIPYGENGYRCNSPLRPGSDSNSFVIKIEGDEHGTFYDHVSKESGSLYALADALGIETPRHEVTDTKRAYSGLEDYARAHGVEPDVLRKALWNETSYQQRPALQFPTKGGTRWRFLDGNRPHYKSERGYKRCWYGLNAVATELIRDGAPLVITNGEISVVSAQHYGLAAVCVTAGENTLSDELIQQLKAWLHDTRQTPDILIAMDCDKAGRHAARGVEQQLCNAGLNARAVDLGLGDRADLADFVMLYGSGSQDKLGKLEPLPSEKPLVVERKRRWEIMHAAELKHLPMIQWLVPGEIPENSLTVLFGPSGVGKSFMALDYALRIAQDKPVVYMAGEGISGYSGRIAAWCKHNQRSEGQLYMCLGAVSFMDDSDLGEFVAEVERIHKEPALIIVDTLARSMVGADENSSRDMGKFVDAAETVRQHFKCTVMIVHHTNKGSIQERGSNALRGAADSMIKLVDEDDQIRVECAKTKDAQPFDTRYVKLLPVDIGAMDRDGNVVSPPVVVPSDKVVQDETSELTKTQRLVLDTLHDLFEGEATGGEIEAVLPEVAHSTMYRILATLKKIGLIRQSAKRGPYYLTDSGKDKIGASPGSLGSPIQNYSDENANDSVISGGTTGTSETMAATSQKPCETTNGTSGTTDDTTDKQPTLPDMPPPKSGPTYHEAGL